VNALPPLSPSARGERGGESPAGPVRLRCRESLCGDGRRRVLPRGDERHVHAYAPAGHLAGQVDRTTVAPRRAGSRKAVPDRGACPALRARQFAAEDQPPAHADVAEVVALEDCLAVDGAGLMPGWARPTASAIWVGRFSPESAGWHGGRLAAASGIVALGGSRLEARVRLVMLLALTGQREHHRAGDARDDNCDE
jgi:hypothetical protein